MKSLMFGSASDTTVYHHEHRSMRKRRPKWEYREAAKHRIRKEDYKLKQMKFEADFIMKKYNDNYGIGK